MKLNNTRVVFNQDVPGPPKVFVAGREMKGVVSIHWDVSTSDPRPAVVLEVLPGVVEYMGDAVMLHDPGTIVLGYREDEEDVTG